MAKNPKKARARAKKAAAASQPTPIQDEAEDEDMDQDEAPSTSNPQQVFHPGVHDLEQGEELDYDRTAYDCLHKWALDWPCLSFDIVKDSLGGPRKAFPHTAFMVAGTQAAPKQQNYLSIMKLAELTQGEHGKDAKDDSEDDDGAMGESEGEEATKESAQLHYRNVACKSAVNRVRCMHQQPGIVATWGENGSVSIVNLSRVLVDLAEEQTPRAKSKNNMLQIKAMHSHAHTTEGFALCWSRQVVGSLASGDCNGKMHAWTPKEGGTWAVSGAFQGHGGSVEDIQWSPTEDTVLASACVDKRIRVFDTRDRSKAQISIEAHTADVNVISWNALTTYMVASGGDDGFMRVWDLRALDSYVASFNHHKKPICSIEWCPYESSMLATASEDNTVAVWDLALERDPEEEATLAPASLQLQQTVPPQLLFLHAGQKDIKEVHWHSQIPGMLASTAGDSFNLFKPANIGSAQDS